MGRNEKTYKPHFKLLANQQASNKFPLADSLGGHPPSIGNPADRARVIGVIGKAATDNHLVQEFN